MRRAEPRIGAGLYDYRARAEGHIYFFLDQNSSSEETLVRADQVALEVLWATPDLTKQRIVGMRDESKLPNQMHYHLDHLTIVQDEFGDRINLGDGDEVSAVVHPAAPGSEETYDFRLADSITIELGGVPEPILVYELEVRPRDFNQPAFIGSVFLDQATASIVRMNFTFTPASYVDPRLDYIQVRLDNGLWEGEYWLPHEQTLEIRREVPILDFPTGSIIRGGFRITDYEFNTGIPLHLFYGPRIVSDPPTKREKYEFEGGLYAGLDEGHLTSGPPDIERLRHQARRVIGREYLSGIRRLRLYIPNSSSVMRYNRAEALYLGGGVSYLAGASTRVRLAGGYSTGRGEPALTGEWRTEIGDGTELWALAGANELHDLGIRPGLPGALNTLAAATIGEDLTDPFFTSGIRAGIRTPLAGPWKLGAHLGHDRERNAELEVRRAPFDRGAEFRPILPIEEGDRTYISISLDRETKNSVGRLWVEASRFKGELSLRPRFQLKTTLPWQDQSGGFTLRADAGLITGEAPPQDIFLIGGPTTLPGYGFRSRGGDQFGLIQLEVTRDLLVPWIRGRATAHAGWARYSRLQAPSEWGASATDGVMTSLGAGLGLFYDLLRLDLVRGLKDGRWEWVISVRPGVAELL